MISRIGSKLGAILASMLISFVFVVSYAVPVSATAQVTVGERRTWGSGGMVGIQVSNASEGEVITVTVTVSGTLTSASCTSGSATYSGNTITAVVNAYGVYWFGVSFGGENLTGTPSVNISIRGSSTPTPSPSPTPVPATPTPVPATPTPVPAATTPAPAATTPAPAQTDPAQTEAPAADPGSVAPAADPAAPAAEVPAADPAAVAPVVDQGVADPAADPGAAVPADTAAPAAEAPAAEPAATEAAAPAAQTQSGNNNGGSQDDEEAEEQDETVETVETEETTVPIVIMDAQGNLITVTPTPTPFPRMSGSTLAFNNTTVNFPFKQVAIGIIIIAVLGTRYFMLKSRGLRGANLALEFVPGVSDIVDKIQRSKGTKIAEAPKTESKTDYSQSTAARAAEAAREAQQARAEFAKAAAERNMAQSTHSAIAGVKAPVKRTSSVPSSGAPKSVPKAKQEPEGIKMAPGFKFTAPIPGQSWTENPSAQPSPFKPNASASTSADAPSDPSVEAPKRSPFKSTPPTGRSN